MKGGFKNIFWGILITVFDINLGPINILPNFLGYFIIGSGINKILDEFENKNFITAKTVSNFLGLYSLILSIANITALNEGFQYENIIESSLFIFSSSISLIMAFFILSGTIELYLSRNDSNHAVNIENKQRKYILLHILGLLLIIFSMNFSNATYKMTVIIYMIVIQIYFAKIISGIGNTFSDDNIEG